MAHCINAIIGTRRALARLIERFGPPPPADLPFGLVIVPVNEQRLDWIAISAERPLRGFTYLTQAMAEQIGAAIGDGRALYIETEYFGGSGGQAAALFEDGSLSWQGIDPDIDPPASPSWAARLLRPPAVARSPISEGLSRLGVPASAEEDEFDQVGLHRFRSPEDLGLDSGD
ncbi:MAG TPA: hypothetical protein VF782_08425 [Allosphingosinicella sp.]|jgi:hypothetical protein